MITQYFFLFFLFIYSGEGTFLGPERTSLLLELLFGQKYCASIILLSYQ